MSTANAKIEPRVAQVRTPRVSAHRVDSGSSQDQGLLLAQIPDLDPKTVPTVPLRRFDGRILSQALSTKLIFGVGFILVIGAILPFMFGKASRPETTVKELPEWTDHDHGGSTTLVGNASQAASPSWPPLPATANMVTPSRPAAEIVLPKAPQAGDARPATLTEPAWAPPRSAGPPATAYAPPPANYANPPANYAPPPAQYANPAVGYANPPTVNGTPADYRGYDRPANPVARQADNRSDPAAGYGNSDPRYNYPSNPPAANYPRDNRYYNGGNNYSPAPPPGSPLMPSGAGFNSNNSNNSNSTNNYRYPPYAEPGAAQFDGQITTPPIRTSYDRAGSSNN